MSALAAMSLAVTVGCHGLAENAATAATRCRAPQRRAMSRR